MFDAPDTSQIAPAAPVRFRPSSAAMTEDNPLDKTSDVVLANGALRREARYQMSCLLYGEHGEQFDQDALNHVNGAFEMQRLIKCSYRWTPIHALEFLTLLETWYAAHEIETIVPLLVKAAKKRKENGA